MRKDSHEWAVLCALYERIPFPGEFFAYFRILENDTKLQTWQVRKACRGLARKGLAEFKKGLMNEDGEVAGAGYTITEEGAKRVKDSLT